MDKLIVDQHLKKDKFSNPNTKMSQILIFIKSKI
jgi:hypothetical protein